MTDVVAPPNVCQRLARRPSHHGFGSLVWGELELAAEFHAPSLRSFAAFSCSGLDELALKLRQPSKHRQHQPPMRRGRVHPSIRQRPEARSRLANRIEHIEQIAS